MSEQQTPICPNFPGQQTLTINEIENTQDNGLSEEEERKILEKVLMLARQKKSRQLKTFKEINPDIEIEKPKTGRPRLDDENTHPLVAKRRNYRRNLYQRHKNGDPIGPRTIPPTQ
jgi:hypothetical protein